MKRWVMISANNYIRNVLILNGIGDSLIGLMLIFASNQLGLWVGFPLISPIIYLAGGWGVEAVSLGLLRLFAGLRGKPELQWFVAIFGLFEGTVLTCYGLILPGVTDLTFFQVSLSTIFALIFAIVYGIGFVLRSQQK